MGKRAGKFKPQVHGQKKVKNEWSAPVTAQENALFRAYYQLQLQLPSEEFQIFWGVMKEKLPVVFRINPSCPNFAAFRAKVQHPNFLTSMLPEGEGEEQAAEGGKHEPTEQPKLQVLPWYPGNILHQINTTKQIFKKSKVLANLHKYLQKGFEAGLIARQQLVSMLPPLFLDIKPQDLVLDMCAAPGSKTSQLLQMQYGSQKSLKQGCVIANDADYGRAQMLIHQINRSGTAGMAVINHPGQFMPELFTGKVGHTKTKFQFDKVLCDVPCSGDGATRKLPIKWAKWHPSDGVSLHPLQLAILMKAVTLLRAGGLLVYSTCSLNPIQNEAVLSGLLSKVGRGLQLVDIHGMYGVKGRRGMPNWEVCGVEFNKEGEVKQRRLKLYKSYQEAKDNPRIKQSMFPPSLDQAQLMNLHYSMRILPHDQNSGGFFVALLRKREDFAWLYDPKKTGKLVDQKDEGNAEEEFLKSNMPEVQNAVALEDDGQGQREKVERLIDEAEEEKEKEEREERDREEENEEGNQKIEEEQNLNVQHPQTITKLNLKQRQPKTKSKESLKYQKFDIINEQQFDSIQKFFGLDHSLRQLLYVRDLQGTSKRKVLLISEGVRRFLQADRDKKIKLVNMGCKVFQKGKESFAGYECLYRLSQEGIHFLLPFMKQRKVRVNLEFFRSVLSIHSLMHDDIADQHIREQIRKMSQGSFCVYIDEIIDGMRVVDALVGQNFKSSFHLMVGKEEIASLNLRYL